MNIMDVKDKIDELGKLPLECDGFTRVFEYFLTMNNIRHQCYVGSIKFGEKIMKPHYWIVTGTRVLDYAIQMWFGKEAPNGILRIELISKFSDQTHINVEEDPNIEYKGVPWSFGIEKSIYNILTRALNE